VQSALSTAAARYGVPVSLLNSVAQAESAYNPNAVSPAGAQGLLQLMPATGASLGVTNPFDPTQNANAGAQYLSQLYAQYGDWGTALIAYNEGPGNLASKGIFPSSQSYADSILANADLSASPMAGSTPLDTASVFDFSGSSDGSGSSLSTGVLVALGIAALGIAWAALR
jgi:soluble lytic murein transglycosylase-like protein